MSDKLRQVHLYRARAERLRAIARELAQNGERELLMQLAEEYDEMARSCSGDGAAYAASSASATAAPAMVGDMSEGRQND